ncbi:MAG: Rrf2 family transcriptional regulator [Planctomycetota bacterium]
MLAFSQAARDAVLAIGCIESGGGHCVSAKDIAAQTGIAEPDLRRILDDLVKAGLVVAKGDLGGGYVVAVAADQMSLGDVVAAVETDDPRRDCHLGLPGPCEGEPCPTGKFWKQERASIEERLHLITVKEVSAFVEKSNPP